jgi:hypothetical protein
LRKSGRELRRRKGRGAVERRGEEKGGGRYNGGEHNDR